MKSLFIVLLIILFGTGAYFVYSYRSVTIAQKNSQEEQEIREVTADGKLRSLGSTYVPESGSHILVHDDGTTVLLSGLGADLEPYIGQDVTVEGRLTTTPSGKELIQVLRVSERVIPESAEQSMTSKELVMYEHSSLGLKFLRRDFWTMLETKSGVLFTISAQKIPCDPDSGVPCREPKDDSITLEKLTNTTSASLASFTGNEKMATKNLIGPDKVIGYKYYDSLTGKIVFVVQRSKEVFRFTYSPGVYRPVDSSANDFHALQNSFQFLPLK